MNEFKDTDRFQKGDKASWYSDLEDKNMTGIVADIYKRLNSGPVYSVKSDGKTYTKNELMLDRINMTNITIQKHGNLTSHISMDSTDFFTTITMATNYAHDKIEELRTKGMGHLVLSDPGLETKIAKIKESYDYWETEYERLSKMRDSIR